MCLHVFVWSCVGGRVVVNGRVYLSGWAERATGLCRDLVELEDPTLVSQEDAPKNVQKKPKSM